MATEAEGPAVVSTVPAEEALGVDRRTRLRVRYDRPLSPWSVDRAAVRLSSGPLAPFLEVRLDPVRNTVVTRPFGGRALEPDVRYRLHLEGVRDLDGREAEAFDLVFRTGDAATSPPPEGVTRWAEVERIFASHCTNGCHDSDVRAAGVDLSTLEAARSTTVGVPSPQTGGTGTVDRRGLGGMRLVEEGDPATSYLIYKMLGDPHVWGEVMPPEGSLPVGQIGVVSDWILAGAR